MNEKPRDDLTQISGIGPVWQKRLASINVQTVKDLSGKTTPEIISALAAKGEPAPSEGDLDDWISQANELVTTAQSPTKPAEKKKISEISNPPTAPDQWKTVGTFVVEYEFLEHKGNGKAEQLQVRINANQDETDNRHRWEEFVVAEPCQWMLEQIKIGEMAPAGLKQLIEKSRVKVQEELEQEIAAKRAEALEALEKEVAEMRMTSTKELDQQLNNVRAQAKSALEKDLAEKRSTTEKELDHELDEER